MKYIYNSFFLALFILATSCEDELNDYSDSFLRDDQLIVNQETAELALVGAYEGLVRTNQGGDVFFNLTAAFQGIEAIVGGPYSVGWFGPFEGNNVSPVDRNITNLYSVSYQIINDVNHIIQKSEPLESNFFTGNRKNEILGEARFLRGFAYFRLLRTWGQFYDINSEFGVIIRDQPADGTIEIPRSSVSDTYDFILNDLDFAIINAPNYTHALQANQLAAKAFKAQVLLYRGQGTDYSDAADIALEVINNTSGATLEASYANVFVEKFESEEVLFASYFNTTTESNSNGFFWGPLMTALSPYYLSLFSGDPRESVVAIPSPFDPSLILNNKFYDLNWDNIVGGDNNAYFSRLSEMYLVRAEALARSGASSTDVKTALNATQSRAGAALSTSDDMAELLDEIRIEKIREIGTETGSTWYDLIRYSELDGLDISALKPSVVNKNQYICPLPITQGKRI